MRSRIVGESPASPESSSALPAPLGSRWSSEAAGLMGQRRDFRSHPIACENAASLSLPETVGLVAKGRSRRPPAQSYPFSRAKLSPRSAATNEMPCASPLQRVALASVAIGAEKLKVLDGRRATHRDGNDVVVLKIEAGAGVGVVMEQKTALRRSFLRTVRPATERSSLPWRVGRSATSSGVGRGSASRGC